MRASIRRREAVRGAGIAAMLAILVSGCLFSPSKKTPEEPGVDFEPRTTVGGVFTNLVTAYENRDLDQYELLFDQNDFMFVFDAVDVQEDPDIPPNWGWPEERTSTRNMFESELVERIQLDFVRANPVPVTENDIGDRPFPTGTQKVIVTDVDLSVDTRDPEGGENIIFKVSGDRAQFFVYQDTLELQDGLPVWKIFEWRDEKLGPRPAGDGLMAGR